MTFISDKPFIREIYEKALPILFPDFKTNKFCNWSLSENGNSVEMGFPLYQYFNLNEQYNYNSNIISHFTSINVLFSILNTESIRLYNLINVNDPNEFLNVMPTHFHKKLKRKKQDIYILSGVDYNNLSPDEIIKMWQVYGDNGKGVRIEFEVIETDIRDNCFLKSICYTPLNTSDFFNEVEKIRKKYNRDKIDVSEMLITPSLLHKENIWQNEKETRLLFYYKHPKRFNDDYPNPNTPIFSDFSQRYNSLCRYYQLMLNDPNSIAHIRIKKIEVGKFYAEPKYQPLIEELGSTQAIRKIKRMGNQFGVTISDI